MIDDEKEECDDPNVAELQDFSKFVSRENDLYEPDEGSKAKPYTLNNLVDSLEEVGMFGIRLDPLKKDNIKVKIEQLLTTDELYTDTGSLSDEFLLLMADELGIQYKDVSELRNFDSKTLKEE